MTPAARLSVTVACLGVLLLALPLTRADRADDVKKQKAAAELNAKKVGLTGLAHFETDDLLVYAGVPEGKVKPLADTLQKTYELSRTTLKSGPNDKPWLGKLTVYVLTDSAQFTTFARLVEQRRPDKGVTYTMNLRGDQPYAVHSVGPGAKVTEAELTADAAALVGAAVLNKMAGAGADLPEWLEMGFGRAMAVRADSNTVKLANHRAKVRASVLGTKSKPVYVRPVEVWGGLKTKDSDTVATSFVEYLLYGPNADQFPKFLAAFKPTEDRPMPSVDAALADLEWKPEALEVGWKQWVAKQK